MEASWVLSDPGAGRLAEDQEAAQAGKLPSTMPSLLAPEPRRSGGGGSKLHLCLSSLYYEDDRKLLAQTQRFSPHPNSASQSLQELLLVVGDLAGHSQKTFLPENPEVGSGSIPGLLPL